MRAHHEFDNAQAQPAAAGLARQALVHLVESPEDSPLFARGNADAIVLHSENHPLA